MAEQAQADATVDTAQPKSTENAETTDNETLEGAGETTETQETIDGESKEETSEPLAESDTADTQTDDSKESAIEEALEEKTDEIDDFLSKKDDTDDKSGVQKRIDKLTAEKYRLQAELDAIKSKERQDKPPGERTYSESELDQAERKALADGDYDLLLTVRKEREKNLKASLRKEYEDAQKKQAEQYRRQQEEWSTVKESYQYLSAPTKPEIYAGSREELNISNPNSNLVRLARTLYSMDRNKVAEILGYSRDYQSPGGQERAVSDALRLILDKRRSRKDSSDAGKLKKQLTREKRKRSLGSSGAQKPEESAPKKALTPDQILNEYVDERNKFKSEKIGL